MKTFLAVTFFFRILTFAFAIGGGPEDKGNDYDKCDDVTPMSDFNSGKFFEKLEHTYVTHSRYGGRLGLCREFYLNKYPNGTIGYNYDFNGNGKPEQGVNSYTVNCTSTEGEQNGQFSFNCTKQNDLDLEGVKQDLLEGAETEEEKAEVEELEELDEDYYKQEFPLKVTVLSTDYKEYALIHKCVEVLYKGYTFFLDNYVVFNIQEGAELPEEAKTKFKEYKWQENTFDTRKICNKKEEIKK